MMKFKLELTPSQIEILDKALQALPLGQALEVYLSIKNQIDVQQVKQVEQNKSGGD